MEVVDPAGETWRVKRRWLPWRLKRRNPDDVVDVSDAAGAVDEPIGLVIVVVVLAVAVLAPVIFVLAFFVAEFLLLLLLLPLFVVIRGSLLGRWPIEAFKGKQLVASESVRGWRASGDRMLEIADGIRMGQPPLPARRHRREGDAD
ncbi:hypothetical protein GCM10022234_30880 [Aeromicrobium panaciterrae]|uniref:hypothetical protein n=1 Tax=Aeromicrobium panaciterrae TaxID=363861 RepID=UPI0031DFB80E